MVELIAHVSHLAPRHPTSDIQCIEGPEGVNLPRGSRIETLDIQPGFFRFDQSSYVVYECEHPKNW